MNLQITFSGHTAERGFFFPGSSRPIEEQFSSNLSSPTTLSSSQCLLLPHTACPGSSYDLSAQC